MHYLHMRCTSNCQPSRDCFPRAKAAKALGENNYSRVYSFVYYYNLHIEQINQFSNKWSLAFVSKMNEAATFSWF